MIYINTSAKVFILGDDPNQVQTNLENFEALAEGVKLTEEAKLESLYMALQKSPLCDRVSPFLEPANMKSYTELKKAIKQALNQTSNVGDFKMIFSPSKREPLLAARAAKRLNPTATDDEIVDMLYKHLSPTAMALIKNNSSSALLADKIKGVLSVPYEDYQLNNVNASASSFEINKIGASYGKSASDRTDKRDMIIDGRCFFHTKYGTEANRCKPGCKHFKSRDSQPNERPAGWPQLHPSLAENDMHWRPNNQQSNDWQSKGRNPSWQQYDQRQNWQQYDQQPNWQRSDWPQSWYQGPNTNWQGSQQRAWQHSPNGGHGGVHNEDQSKMAQLFAEFQKFWSQSNQNEQTKN